MAYCQKCGKQLSEGVEFCADCGTPVNQSNEAPQTVNSAAETVTAGVNQLAEQLSLSPFMLCAGAGMGLLLLYNLVNYLGAWSLTLPTFFSALLTPALFALLIFTQSKNKDRNILFIAPFGLRGLSSVIFLLRSLTTMSLRGWLANLAHIALGALFILTVFGKLDGKRIMPIVSGAAAVVLGIMYFRYGFMSGLMQIIYFGSVLLILLSLDMAGKRN